MSKLKYIDVFAGCGGISLGLYNSGYWQGIFAIEKNPDAFNTLNHNLIDNRTHFAWPKWLPIAHHDINDLLDNCDEEFKSLRGTIDLVVGGPPCQGFSFAGQRMEEDSRNSLVISYLKMIEYIQPNAILLENVKGFSTGFKKTKCSTTGRVEHSLPMSEVVLERLRELGYSDAFGKLINFSQFGVPQNRTRFIIAATKHKRAHDFFKRLEQKASVFRKDKGLAESTCISDAISDLLEQHGKITSPDTPSYKAGKYGTKNSVFQKLMRENSMNTNPDSHRFVKHSNIIRERFKQIIDEQLTSREIRIKYKTKKSSVKLLEPKLPSPTLTTLPDDYIHYCEPRVLTVREYARIQSFPDWYEFKGKYTTGGVFRKLEVPRYSQIGNAIPPLFGEIAGIIFGKILNEIQN